MAQIYFDDFIRFIAEHLFNVFSSANPQSKFYRFGIKSQKLKYIEDLVLKIRTSTSAQSESEIGSNIKASRRRHENESAARRIAASIGAGVGLKKTGVPSAEGHIGLKMEDDEAKKITADFQDTISYLNFKLDYSLTRKLIEELLDALGFDKLYIFLDEWSELDRTGASEIQPYFADLVKRVFWKNPKFVLKIGAIRNLTRLNTTAKTGGIIGLELAADLFELNLDSVYSESELNKIWFFEELVFRHLAACNPELLMFQRNSEAVTPYGTFHGRPLDTFITHIFKSREVFRTLVVGSGSLPRDFIEMFDALAQHKKFSVDPLWSIADVKSAVRDHYLKNKHSPIKRNDLAMDLCTKIMAKVISNNSRLIVVPNSARTETLFAAAELYHRRLLHDVALADIPPLLRNDHNFYYADLGLLYDVSKKVFEDPTDLEEVCPLQGNETNQEIAKYVVN